MEKPPMKIRLLIAFTFLLALFISGCENTGGPANTSGNNSATDVEQTEVSDITEAEATSILNDLGKAVGSNDVDALDKIYADDFHLVTNEGKVETKAQRLESMKSGKVKYQSVEFSNPKVRIYGNTAVVVADTAGKMTVDGKEAETSLVATIVFVKSKDGVREVSAHLTNRAKE